MSLPYLRAQATWRRVSAWLPLRKEELPAPGEWTHARIDDYALRATTSSRMSGKQVTRTGSAYTKTIISQLPQPHHGTVVELLESLLRPIGEHRTAAAKPRKKRDKKRKRQTTIKHEEEEQKQNTSPLRPRVLDNVLIGFNSVTRHLEDLSAASANQAGFRQNKIQGENGKELRHVAAVFLLRPLDDLIYSHLPTLSYTASFAHANAPPTRVVLLDASAEKKLAASLAQMRVSVLAVLDHEKDEADTRQLIEYVRENVEAVDVPWLKEVIEAKWLGTRVELQ